MGNARARSLDTQPRGEEIGNYDTYAQAQRAVDYLSDQEFGVQAVTIVGTDLKMVERITGRLNYPRAALSGAASGAWFGLFVGLVLALLTGGEVLSTLGFALLIGAGFGMLFGVIAYALTGGKRDFTSSSQVVASSFAVLCLPETAPEARRLLGQIDGGTGNRAAARPLTPSAGTRSTDQSAAPGTSVRPTGTDRPGTTSPDSAFARPAGTDPAQPSGATPSQYPGSEQDTAEGTEEHPR